MNINSINLLSNNFAGKIRIQNRTPLYEKDTEPKYKKISLVIDTVAFSKPSQRRKETVTDILKDAKIANRPRFTVDERRVLSEELRKFSCSIPTSKVLKELLDISYTDNNGKKQMLSVVDIASFLSVTNFATAEEINGVLNFIKADINTGLINDSESLDDNVFLPIENHPEMLTQIGKLENGYKHLSPMRRGEIISTYRDVVEASDYKLINLSKEIAEVIHKDTRQSMSRLLFEGAESLSKKEFKALLKSLTPEQYAKLYEEYANCNDATSEQEFFDSYIDKFAKNTYSMKG